MSGDSSGQVPTLTKQPEQPAAINSAAENSVEGLTQFLESQGLPPAKASFVIERVTTEIRSHKGPLPSVDDFAGYDRVCPGSAREILDMAVRQQQHNHQMDRYNASCEFWLPVTGILVAALIIVGMLSAGVYLAMNDHENLAIGVFSGTGIATVAGAFLQRRRSEDQPQSPPPVAPGPGTPKERKPGKSRPSNAGRRR